MMTLRQFAEPPAVPAATAWHLADLAQAVGRQQMLTKQAPRRLKVLREHALIESAVSSNRIDGVDIEPARMATVVLGAKHLRDRDEEEVRGYRQALDLIHAEGASLPINEETIRRLHTLSRGGLGDAGEYKQTDNDIVEVLTDGRQIRFRTVRAADTAAAMRELIDRWLDILARHAVHPLIALAAFNLDFLSIHPFRDGNGRVSRLLLLLLSYQQGVEVGRYISLERLIEHSKDRYYETFKRSTEDWHDGGHDPWPYIGYVLYTLLEAYREFDRRMDARSPRGEKAEVVRQAIMAQAGEFRVSDIERACPGVGREWIGRLLADFKKRGEVVCAGRGPAARWRRLRPGAK